MCVLVRVMFAPSGFKWRYPTTESSWMEPSAQSRSHRSLSLSSPRTAPTRTVTRPKFWSESPWVDRCRISRTSTVSRPATDRLWNAVVWSAIVILVIPSWPTNDLTFRTSLLHDVTVNIPTFFKSSRCPTTVMRNHKIASKRVHVDRLIGLAKSYKILVQPMNAWETQMSSDIIFVRAMLCNIRAGIVPRDAWGKIS